MNGTNKATSYKGNGRFAYQLGQAGVMFQRPLTGTEVEIAGQLSSDCEDFLGPHEVFAGTNMGRDCWTIRCEDGRMYDDYRSLADLASDVRKIRTKLITDGLNKYFNIPA
jgi:hypothetical protein